MNDVVKPPVIKPTIGRIVWFWKEPPASTEKQAEPAIVCFVHDDNHVNLSVTTKDGRLYPVLNAYLRQPGDEIVPNGAYAEWMPFQVGQAKRAEELKKPPDDLPVAQTTQVGT